MNEFGSVTPPSETEIAHYLNISVDTVKKTQKEAINKSRADKSFAGIIESHDGRTPIMTEQDFPDGYKINK